MKRIKIITLIVMIFTTNNLYAEINNLLKGVTVNDTTLNELSTTTSPNAFAYGISWLSQKSVKGGAVNAFVKIPNSTDLYSLSSSQNLFHTNYDTRTLLGNWPLTPPNFPCEAPTHCLASPWYSVRWNSGEALEKSVIDRYQNFNYSIQPYYDQKAPTLGCLGDSPLKYGDIEGDGVNELVLYIGGNWMIFSTALNKVTFMTMMDVGDWMSEAQTIKYFAYYREPENALLPKEAQYQSLTSLSARGGSYLSTPGYRGYSKLYFGDFDNDAATAADILVWRKLYQSRLAEDPLKGFEKLSDMYAHFRLVDGEYQRQTTEQSQIQTWISSNNETWSSGYPSTSECVGQEGQLIPEMHDPLLNDPDVLVPVPVVAP